jgi:rhodanese-related sulfurtransferase
MLKNSFARAVVLISVALVLAIVTNGFASRTRRLVLKGFYPDALRVPPPPVTTTTVATTTVPTATVAPATIEPIATQTLPSTSTTSTVSTTSTASTVPVKTTTAPPPPTTTAPPPPATDPLARFKPHPAQAYVEISGADAALLHANGALFLDARRTSVYEAGHIAGARSFSVWESDIDDKVNALYGERSDPSDQDKPIVIYCSGGACEDSHMLSQKLWGIQFNNLYVYKDGFPDWQDRNGAVRTGGQP